MKLEALRMALVATYLTGRYIGKGAPIDSLNAQTGEDYATEYMNNPQIRVETDKVVDAMLEAMSQRGDI